MFWKHHLLELVIAILASLLAGCASTSAGSGGEHKLTPRDEQRRARPQAVQEYLELIYQRLASNWASKMQTAQESYPAEHPVNQRDLMVEIELRLEVDGKPSGLRVVQSSGYHLFDNTALHLLTWIRDPPVLPEELGRGRAVLRWRFFRDERGCRPAYAKLEFNPLTPPELLWQAIQDQDWGKAGAVIEGNPGQSMVLAVLADAGLSTKKDPLIRQLALHLVTPRRIQAALGEELSWEVWQTGVRILAGKQQENELLGLLRELVQPRLSWIISTPTDPLVGKKIRYLMQSLQQVKATVPETLLNYVLRRKEPEIIMRALALARSVAFLEQMKGAYPKLLPLIAVKQLSLRPDKKIEAQVRTLLQSKEPRPALEALIQMPVQALAEDIAALMKDHRQSAVTQLLALKAYSKLEGQDLAFYPPLNSPHPEVQIATARALSRLAKNKRSVGYRLAGMATTSKGPVAAEALAAVTRLGIEYFCADVIYRTSRLPVAEQGLVIRELWRFGKCAEGTLRRMEAQPDPAIQKAAQESLAHYQKPEQDTAASKMPATNQLVELLRRATKLKHPSPLLDLLLLALRQSHPGLS